MNPHSIILVLILSFSAVVAQNVPESKKDTCCPQSKVYVGLTSPNIDNTVYTAMQNIWNANEKISYICLLPKYHYIETPVLPLVDGEGKKGFLFDANIYQQIPVFMGRNHANHGWQTTRLTLDFSFNIRMALDSSNPLLPNNDVIGFTVDKVVWDSRTRKFFPFKIKDEYSYENWNCREDRLSNWSLNITGHHYSNGQPPGFFIRDTIEGIPLVRNDYKHGDFSTNYIQGGLTYSHLNKSRSLFSIKAAYQWDGTIGGPLVYSSEQEKSYGHNRFVGFVQYRLLWRRLNPCPATILSVCDGEGCEYKTSVYLYKAYEFIFRYDYEYITGNLDLFPHANKYRLNQHLFVEFTRPNWRALGLVLHGYYGRDYSNIRYDLPVWTIMGGICINFNKYRPAFSDRQKFSVTPQPGKECLNTCQRIKKIFK